MKILHLIFVLAAAAEIAIPASIGLPVMNQELERGLALAIVAASPHSALCAEAEAVYTQARALLPRIHGLRQPELADLQAKVKELRMALDLIPGAEDPPEKPTYLC